MNRAHLTLRAFRGLFHTEILNRVTATGAHRHDLLDRTLTRRVVHAQLRALGGHNPAGYPCVAVDDQKVCCAVSYYDDVTSSAVSAGPICQLPAGYGWMAVRQRTLWRRLNRISWINLAAAGA